MNIARSSIIVSIFTIIGLGLGLLSNIVVAMKFGARTDMDIFLAATTVPLFIISIISGALNFTFIPVFAEYRTKRQVEAWRVVSSFINLSLIVSIVICIAGMVMAEHLTKIIVPGFSRDQVVHTAALLRWLLPLIVFTVMNELMASVYYSDNRFVVPSINKVVSPIITMVYVLLFHESISTKSLVFAMLTAAFLQATLLGTGFLKSKNYHYSFSLDYQHPGVQKILKLMIPLVFGMIVYRAVPVFDRYFLSVLPSGSISHIDYAMKFINIISAVIVSGITVSVFPGMAKYAAEDNIHELKRLISKVLRMLFFLSVPVVIFLGIFGKPVVRFAFERGAFVASDTSAVYHAFSLFILALPAIVIGVVIGQGFYVLKDTMTVAIIGVGEMVIYVILCYALLQLLGYLAIPIAYAAQFNIGVLLLGIILRYKLGNKGGITIFLSMAKHLVAALVPMAIIIVFFKFNMSDIITTMVFIPMCFIAYLLISRFVFLSEEAVHICEVIMHVFRKINFLVVQRTFLK